MHTTYLVKNLSGKRKSFFLSNWVRVPFILIHVLFNSWLHVNVPGKVCLISNPTSSSYLWVYLCCWSRVLRYDQMLGPTIICLLGFVVCLLCYFGMMMLWRHHFDQTQYLYVKRLGLIFSCVKWMKEMVKEINWRCWYKIVILGWILETSSTFVSFFNLFLLLNSLNKKTRTSLLFWLSIGTIWMYLLTIGFIIIILKRNSYYLKRILNLILTKSWELKIKM